MSNNHSIVPYSPTHDITDGTKLKTFMECPRSFFFEYVLGWRPITPNLHLEFGKAWHLAMEHMLLYGYGADSVKDAYHLLEAHYRQFWGPEMDDSNAPKNPQFAIVALMQYAAHYRDDQFKPIHTEIAGSVPMDDTHRLHFRMDSILELPDGKIRSREHKTGSTMNRQWQDQWTLSPQTFVYNHVLYCLYPSELVWGVEINGTFFQKKQNQFLRVPCRCPLPMMQARYWDILDTMYQLEYEWKRLSDASDSDDVLTAFPRRPTACTNWFGCKYFDFCQAWPNPLQYIADAPLGFKIEHWNPMDEPMKVNLELEKMEYSNESR